MSEVTLDILDDHTCKDHKTCFFEHNSEEELDIDSEDIDDRGRETFN